ncbi:uncharacterized protein LOC116613937 [Nematostella vectensis]|uniref:uncharacterized protein LOC116613937 n=1 Tax=Nematostella vectensis TaxID=45351 RepID=UPI002076E570|nr:uncharacterized protein LOC116613937 [Nematostella vectensis]
MKTAILCALMALSVITLSSAASIHELEGMAVLHRSRRSVIKEIHSIWVNRHKRDVPVEDLVKLRERLTRVRRSLASGPPRVIKIELKFKRDWLEPMARNDSAQYQLMDGNVLDALFTELIGDTEYIESKLLALKKSDDVKPHVLGDIELHFDKNEEDPIKHLREIVRETGRISSEEVFNDYFVVLDDGKGGSKKEPIKADKPATEAVTLPVNPAKPSHPNDEEFTFDIHLNRPWNPKYHDYNSKTENRFESHIRSLVKLIFDSVPGFVNDRVAAITEGPDLHPYVRLIMLFKPGSDRQAIQDKMLQLVKSGKLGDVLLFTDYLNGPLEGQKPAQSAGNPASKPAEYDQSTLVRPTKTHVSQSSGNSYTGPTAGPTAAATAAGTPPQPTQPQASQPTMKPQDTQQAQQQTLQPQGTQQQVTQQQPTQPPQLPTMAPQLTQQETYQPQVNQGVLVVEPTQAVSTQQQVIQPVGPTGPQGTQQQVIQPVWPTQPQGTQQQASQPIQPTQPQGTQQQGTLPIYPSQPQGTQQQGTLPIYPSQPQGTQQQGTQPMKPTQPWTQPVQPTIQQGTQQVWPTPSVRPTSSIPLGDQPKSLSGTVQLDKTWYPFIGDVNGATHKILSHDIEEAIKDSYGNSPVTVRVDSLGPTENNKIQATYTVTFPSGSAATLKPIDDAVAQGNLGGLPVSGSPLPSAAPVSVDSPQLASYQAAVVPLPSGIPRSCEEIRSSGIGTKDGEYVLLARPNCHLNVICQNMNDPHPKEYLGGPSQKQWMYWHYAVLVKLSAHDKQNIDDRACLENTAVGRQFISKVMKAGAQQGNPLVAWKTNVKRMIHSYLGKKRRRSQDNMDVTLGTKAIKIYKRYSS